MCNECRSFGGALLSALEKNDAEALAVMRSTHEVGILDLMHRVKVRQLDEANAQIDALNASRSTAVQRYGYYQKLMGVSGTSAPASGASIPLLPVPSQPPVDVGGIQLIPEEGLELVLSTSAAVLQAVAAGIQAFATPMHAIPQIGAFVTPIGVGANATEGGPEIGGAADSGASVVQIHRRRGFPGCIAFRQNGQLFPPASRMGTAKQSGRVRDHADRQADRRSQHPGRYRHSASWSLSRSKWRTRRQFWSI